MASILPEEKDAQEPVPLAFEHNNKKYKGEAVPITRTCTKDVCYELDITLNDESLGIIRCMKSGWKMDLVKDQKLIDMIGKEIRLYYE